MQDASSCIEKSPRADYQSSPRTLVQACHRRIQVCFQGSSLRTDQCHIQDYCHGLQARQSLNGSPFSQQAQDLYETCSCAHTTCSYLRWASIFSLRRLGLPFVGLVNRNGNLKRGRCSSKPHSLCEAKRLDGLTASKDALENFRFQVKGHRRPINAWFKVIHQACKASVRFPPW